VDGSCIDADFICAGIEQAPDILHGAHAATNREGNKDLAGHAFHGFIGGGPIFVAGGDIQKRDFVSTLLVVAASHFDRIAGISYVDKADAFDNAAAVDIKARDDAFGEGHAMGGIKKATAVAL
jgi:hypothetical protein